MSQSTYLGDQPENEITVEMSGGVKQKRECDKPVKMNSKKRINMIDQR